MYDELSGKQWGWETQEIATGQARQLDDLNNSVVTGMERERHSQEM